MKNGMPLAVVLLLFSALCLTTCHHAFLPHEEIDAMYDAKVGTMSNGTIIAIPEKGMEGAEIQFIINPDPGYKLRAIQVHVLGITNIDGGNVTQVYQNSQRIYFVNMPKGGALISGEFVPVSSTERSVTMETGTHGQVIVSPSSGVAGTVVKVFSYIDSGYSFKSGYPRLAGASWTSGKEGYEFVIGSQNVNLISEFEKPSGIGDIISNARRAMDNEEFDTAFSYYEVAYQIDKTNEEALFYSILGKLISIGNNAKVRSLLMRAGMGNAPGTINSWLNLETADTTNWLKTYTDDNNDTYTLPRLEPPGVFPGGFLNYDIDRNNVNTRFGFDLRLLWNMIGNNPEGFNEYIETTLQEVFGGLFEEACARADLFPENQTITLNPVIAQKFRLDKLYGSGDITVGAEELDILIAFLRSLKAAVEWLYSYDWEMDLTVLRIEPGTGDTINMLLDHALVQNLDERLRIAKEYSLLARILPLRSKFMKLRDGALMGKSKTDFLLAVNQLNNSIDVFYSRLSSEAKGKYAWLAGSGGFAKQLKSAVDSGGNFYIPEIPQYKSLLYVMEGETGWITPAEAWHGINLGKLFEPGYLTANKIIVTEPGGKAPLFFGFKGTTTGTAIENFGEIATFDTFSLQLGQNFKNVFVKLKGKDVSGCRWVYEVFPDFFPQENDAVERAFAKTNVSTLFEHYQRR